MNTPVLSQSLDTLLQIENDKELIEYTCPSTGMPIWQLIRVHVIRTIMSDWLFKSVPLNSFGQNVNYVELARNATIAAVHNMALKATSKRKILIQSTGLGNFNQEGLIYDRLVGYFKEALPKQTLVYQDKPKINMVDKYSFGPVLHKLPRNLLNKIYSKIYIRNTHKNLAHYVIRRAVENASIKLGYKYANDKILTLTNALAHKLAVLPYESETYANWFSKQGFKLLLKEDACFGGSAVSIIHAARINGMTVAEYQHGAITKGHDAYNVADALVKSDLFREVLPDYLLTYGNWWSKQTNIPVKKIAIGNPHLTEIIKKLDIERHKKDQILVLGDGIETDLYLNLASRVFEMVNGKKMPVVFRPHPFEREKIKSIILPYGVELDGNLDIYQSLNKSRVVISELSTGLFEAVGLVEKILLWETDKSRFAFPEIPFMSFSTMDELESILNESNLHNNGYSTVSASDLWEPNWKINYLRFVESALAC